MRRVKASGPVVFGRRSLGGLAEARAHGRRSCGGVVVCTRPQELREFTSESVVVEGVFGTRRSEVASASGCFSQAALGDGSVGWTALRLCVRVAFGFGMLWRPERVCGVRGLKARRVSGRRIRVARCGMEVSGVGMNRRHRHTNRLSGNAAPGAMAEKQELESASNSWTIVVKVVRISCFSNVH